MTSVDQLARLFTAIAAGDLQSAQAVAGNIADAEEKSGHHTAAQRLRGSLRPNGVKSTNGANGAHVASSTILIEALTPVTEAVPLREVQLRSAARAQLERLKLEWSHRDRMKAAGLPRRDRLLFHGPPGCGKSMTAAALSKELALPCHVVRLDAVVGSYLGQTAVHLREIFRFAESTPCVLLFDEVDALGKQRGDPLDVGELHRIVIAMMQELEHAHPAGFIIATSNLPKKLDAALWRRFDLVLEFPRPSRREITRYAEQRTKSLRVDVTPGVRKAVVSAVSYAEAERALLEEARHNLLGRLERPRNGR